MKVVSLAISRDGTSGGVVHTVTICLLSMQFSYFVSLLQKYILEELTLADCN